MVLSGLWIVDLKKEFWFKALFIRKIQIIIVYICIAIGARKIDKLDFMKKTCLPFSKLFLFNLFVLFILSKNMALLNIF